MFGRNYEPTFHRTSEEYLAMINEILVGKEFCIVPNDAPYNLYTKRTGQVEVETEHYTLYYKNRKNPRVWEEVSPRLERGYSIQEVADELKSIPLPHIHLIKVKGN